MPDLAPDQRDSQPSAGRAGPGPRLEMRGCSKGQILIDGREVSIHSPRDAQKLGVAMIHAELHLVPELSIADNIFLGREPKTSRGTVDRARLRHEAAELLAQLDLEVPPTRLVRLCRPR
jgi:ribose transport system ATP-binding protein